MKHALWVIGIMTVAACSAVQPLPIRTSATCYRCRRPVEDLKLAAEIIDQNRHVYTFRTAGCLATYLTEHAEDPLAVFVTDKTSGKMIRVQSALFVRATIDPKTNERDYVAFSSVPDAVAFANQQGGSAIDWAAVMAQTRVSKGN
ncbi:MAG: nitrous oxide reductase accessory protein NosL [Acidobacteria bacterium]|nr:nitrous oxide reductase accessory protein NosL [Acidobacteriota bacterium]MBI3265370.1 nitrous oxide reductase accessory protein NosL [Acidobacteriota bacterium]